MNTTALDRTVAEPPNYHLMTRTGVRLMLRAVEPGNAAALNTLLGALTQEDMRFRFLVSQNAPDTALVGRLATVDHRRTEHVVAFDERSRQPVASLMIAADLDMQSAEVAIAVASGARGRGIGWTLLNHAADLARMRGIKTLRSVENRANHDALEVEQQLGFVAKSIEGEPGLVMVEAHLG